MHLFLARTVGALATRKEIISIGSAARQLIFHLRVSIAARPRLNALIVAVLERVPILNGRLRTIIQTERASQDHAAQMPTRPVDPSELSPRAHQVYSDLIQALRDLQ
jgi:hypothetical protein